MLLSGYVTKQASISFYRRTTEDVLLSAQAPEISAADRPDNIMRYDRSAESDSSRSLLSSSFATYVYIFFFQLKRTFDVLTTT